ncbi:hypothetical protein B0P06_005264 [Clostridium saccharoperbutylacetonicum]|uniref:Uncharacterized protein n=1 Tax=Clostridium saccharoperbutylacetonicum N1-4(HMT) TaxID=931276 RepID=M1MYH4_9CLOT|nr:LysM peptidoglycan-binding domain-containing protein [Clostridium saccharoperbutylacetonicum]AGF56467.1 hypothetical protein Cspa_c27020 [Clostridium saccharoperbutylacetonicum N1-4(HMT)]NRT62786.1 hypothetical protein [Clostridium saccharoperbutylacetonicum]NSB26140.1 hypothetical protein [Clostridium saccharoperbutylacetonicum]NSB45493.1 hypothetical protein [Clostridium saccharoperbutylacetonicum]
MIETMTMGQFSSLIRITTLNNYNSMQYVSESNESTPIDNRLILLPVSPSDLMFDEDSDVQTIKLMNYGEYPVNINKKLASWSVSSFFPCLDSNYPFVKNSELKDPYEYYCKTLLTWKNNKTPLVFMFKTWGSYYSCQIKNFKFGRKDSIGNIYYDLQFQEYRILNLSSGENGTTDYAADIYYPSEGETIQDVAKKLYGSSEYYKTIMSLNNLTNPFIKAGVGYKIR